MLAPRLLLASSSLLHHLPDCAATVFTSGAALSEGSEGEQLRRFLVKTVTPVRPVGML